MNQSQIESLIWGVADLIRDTFKRGKVLENLDPQFRGTAGFAFCKITVERPAFEKDLAKAAREAGVKLAEPVPKALLEALSERNPEAEICRDQDGHPEPDPELRDTESVPLAESIEADIQVTEKDSASVLREVAG